jgi:hypothetical protein
VFVAKLTGNVDGAKILEYAPAEIQKLPGYEGPQVGGPTKLGGFDATQIGGAYTKNGVKRAIGQMTAVIPGQDGCTSCSSTPTASESRIRCKRLRLRQVSSPSRRRSRPD